MSKPTVVAIYARVSTSEQNPEAQLLALREYTARRGFCIYKEYVDHVSGDVQQRRAKRQNDHAYQGIVAPQRSPASQVGTIHGRLSGSLLRRKLLGQS